MEAVIGGVTRYRPTDLDPTYLATLRRMGMAVLSGVQTGPSLLEREDYGSMKAIDHDLVSDLENKYDIKFARPAFLSFCKVRL